MVGVIMTWQVFMKGHYMGGQNPKIIQNQMVDSYLFGGSQSIALVALEVIFLTYTDLYLEKFRVQLSGGAADWGFKLFRVRQ